MTLILSKLKKEMSYATLAVRDPTRSWHFRSDGPKKHWFNISGWFLMGLRQVIGVREQTTDSTELENQHRIDRTPGSLNFFLFTKIPRALKSCILYFFLVLLKTHSFLLGYPIATRFISWFKQLYWHLFNLIYVAVLITIEFVLIS